MRRPTTQRSLAARTAARVGTVITAIALALGITAGTALAATPKWSGDFSWAQTKVRRLANCAATHWYNAVQQSAGATGDDSTGGKLTACDGAGSDPWWDGEHLLAADDLSIDARRVAYRSDQSCPKKRGFQYIKCWYVNGKQKGNPVMTVSVINWGPGGMAVAVDWYYL
ncbi:hypothetical protein RKE30_38100 [Streptomyces sp. Li-HN-5-11]|uniref:hypothetical protein n=1 Tax=Streptomyces sp. Li-HN-5-11 TaxID=3075432 RepID=UPI0028B037A0|nr:hypothetical protein [Streptomyces sp. Li-HN-5-11]WNM35765.1 hypothetical protein RKE30_38100 [Streptomyces sp. Li-HN-5-11]